MNDTTLSSLDNWDHHIFSSKLGVDRFKNIIIDAGLNRTGGGRILGVLERGEGGESNEIGEGKRIKSEQKFRHSSPTSLPLFIFGVLHHILIVFLFSLSFENRKGFLLSNLRKCTVQLPNLEHKTLIGTFLKLYKICSYSFDWF